MNEYSFEEITHSTLTAVVSRITRGQKVAVCPREDWEGEESDSVLLGGLSLRSVRRSHDFLTNITFLAFVLVTSSHHSFIKFYPKIHLCQDTTIATICPTTADTRPTLASFRRSSSNFHWRRVLAWTFCELRSLDVSVCRSKFCVVFVCDRERARLVCAVI
uniref:(northern house mosquito) hypothetical protein n=1 Tax=Culex pipiens TaxID=7175 RepID=A0A8D8BPT9_CULPI